MDMISSEILRRLWSNDEPVYLYDDDIVRRNILTMRTAFKRLYSNFELAYSFKTNYLFDICRAVKDKGCIAEVVSGDEYSYAKSIGFPDERIIFNGVTHSVKEKFSCAMNYGCVNVDNYDELAEIASIAKKRGVHISAGVRVNFPISNGLVSRFGVDIYGNEFKEIMRLFEKDGFVKFSGFHCHIGSSRPVRYWREKAEIMAALAKEYNAEYVDLGGGMFGPMPDELSRQFSDYEPSFDEYAKAICGVMTVAYPDAGCKLIVEPGTAIVGNSMRMAATVTNIKDVRGKTFVTVNCNSNQLGVISDLKELPISVVRNKLISERMDVRNAIIGGNTCLEYDYLSRDFSGEIGVGDRLVFDNVGAYSIGSSRQFIVPRPAVCDLSGMIVRRKESWHDMFDAYMV